MSAKLMGYLGDIDVILQVTKFKCNNITHIRSLFLD